MSTEIITAEPYRFEIAMKTVGTKTWIRQLREEADLTQEQLAVKLNIAASTLRTWEQGKEPSMTMKQWEILAATLNLSLNDLQLKISGFVSAA